MQETTRRSPRIIALAMVFSAAWLVVPAPATAQQIGIGYVANAPDQLIGGGAYAVLPFLGGAGVYVDYKADVLSPAREDNYLDDFTADDAREEGDLLFADRDSWSAWNLALVWAVTEDVLLYGGGGQANRTVYGEFSSNDPDRGTAGWYWVEDDGASTTEVNVLGGAIVRLMGPIRVHLGLESAPVGMTVGLSYLLDLRR